jgi:hypothetical protein
MPQLSPDIAAMRRPIAILLLVGFGLGCGMAAAEPIPLPRPRPPIWLQPRTFVEAVAGLDFDASDVSSAPTPCDERLATMAEIEPVPRLIGPGACGGRDMVRLDAVWLADRTRIAMNPAPVLRCAMAESLAAWVHDEAAARAAALGANLRAVDTYDDYECRPRNRVPGGKLSEHGHGNAVDLRAFTLDDGRMIELTDLAVAKDFREALRDSACRRFTTVLGPGADSHHNGHIHLDILERSRGYRICEWEVQEPLPPEPVSGQIDPAHVPLPLPRPVIADSPVKHSRKL